MNRSEIIPILTQCQAGDTHAIADLVEAHRPALYRMALSILDDSAEADEAAQEVLVQAVAKMDSYRGECTFTNWLFAITLNVCRGRLRKRQRHWRLKQTLQTLFHIHAVELEHPEQVAIQNEADQAVWQAIAALPGNLRLAITLRYYHDLAIADVAQVLGVSKRTVHTRLSQAYERLRGLLDWRAAR